MAHVDKSKLLSHLWDRWHALLSPSGTVRAPHLAVQEAMLEGLYEQVKRGEFDLDLDGLDATTRADDPDTSHEAADSVSPHVTKTMENILAVFTRAQITVLFDHRVVMTDEQIHDWYEAMYEIEGWRRATPQSIRSRRKTLVDLGMLEMARDPEGEPIYGTTQYGRRCHTWTVTS